MDDDARVLGNRVVIDVAVRREHDRWRVGPLSLVRFQVSDVRCMADGAGKQARVSEAEFHAKLIRTVGDQQRIEAEGSNSTRAF